MKLEEIPMSELVIHLNQRDLRSLILTNKRLCKIYSPYQNESKKIALKKAGILQMNFDMRSNSINIKVNYTRHNTIWREDFKLDEPYRKTSFPNILIQSFCMTQIKVKEGDIVTISNSIGGNGTYLVIGSETFEKYNLYLRDSIAYSLPYDWLCICEVDIIPLLNFPPSYWKEIVKFRKLLVRNSDISLICENGELLYVEFLFDRFRYRYEFKWTHSCIIDLSSCYLLLEFEDGKITSIHGK